ncbi:MAG TPA: DUF4262 domain-containing protein [Kribbellaceae bacterium]|nr:DUF4262 domain-containing protein [Kribbellaceae bacterium]
MCATCQGITAAEYWDLLTSSILERGWFVQATEGNDGDSPYAYTVGLTMLGHPELVVFGMEPAPAEDVLAAVAEQVLAGREFTDGDDVSFLYDARDPVILLQLPDSSTHLHRANDLYRESAGPPVPALQLFWPSAATLRRRAA